MLFFAYVALLTHSMFDLGASRWPTNILLLLSQGILLGQLAKKITANKERSGGITTLTAIAAAVLTLTIGVGMAVANANSSLERRMAGFAYNVDDLPLALHFYDKSIAYEPNPQALYNAGILSLLRFDDPYLAWKYFSELESRPDKILAHANSHMADCCLRFNRKKEALHYLDLEVSVQKTSLVALYNKLILERTLHMDDDAKKTAQALIMVLRFKGLRIKDLHMVLANPGYDGKFFMLKKQ